MKRTDATPLTQGRSITARIGGLVVDAVSLVWQVVHMLATLVALSAIGLAGLIGGMLRGDLSQGSAPASGPRAARYQAERTERVFRRDGRRCRFCGTPFDIRVGYHGASDVPGDGEDDLVTVCAGCVAKGHARI